MRRSALISLSNPSDLRMRKAKTGNWWDTRPYLQLSNNSACYTENPSMELFFDEWPVFGAAAIREPICCEIGVETIKSTLVRLLDVLVLDQQRQNRCVQFGVPNREVASGREETCPLFWRCFVN